MVQQVPMQAWTDTFPSYLVDVDDDVGQLLAVHALNPTAHRLRDHPYGSQAPKSV